MQTTESGLVVPDGTLPKIKKAMRPDSVKRIRRFMNDMKDEGLAVLVTCHDCKDVVSFAAVDKLDPKAPGGRIVASCKCSEREVRC